MLQTALTVFQFNVRLPWLAMFQFNVRLPWLVMLQFNVRLPLPAKASEFWSPVEILYGTHIKTLKPFPNKLSAVMAHFEGLCLRNQLPRALRVTGWW